MKKKLFFLMALAALLCLCAGALAAPEAILDEADLFSVAEEAHLTELIEEFRSETSMDFVILTSYEAHDDSQAEIADNTYDRGGYGLGDENSGILYYIDMYERIPYLSTAGEMIDYMTDERIEAAHEYSYDHLASGNYAKAAETMIASVTQYVQRGIPEGQYQYDILTGRQLTARHKALTSDELLVCAIIAAAAALIFGKSVQNGYSLKGSTYEYSFRENSQVELTGSADDYLRTTTTRTRKAPPPSSGGSSRSSGSGVHRSSGGVRHGGGAGRKF